MKEELKNNRIFFGLESGIFISNEILLVSKRKWGNDLPFIRKESIQDYFTFNDFNENKQKDIFSYIYGDKWKLYPHKEECVITLTDQELTFLKELKKKLLN